MAIFFLVAVGMSACDSPPAADGRAAEGPDEVEPELPPVGEVASADIYAVVCAACHGTEGRGKPELQAPAIAGLPSWYVVEQVEKFRQGHRGTHPEDLPGVRMAVIARSLTPDQIDAAANAVAALPASPTEIIAGGDVERGRTIFAEICMPCHRFNGQGERAFHSAPLVTLNPEYLRRSLNNYTREWRGAAPGDHYGRKMVNVASGLSDRDIEDLVRYIGELAHGDDPRRALNREER